MGPTITATVFGMAALVAAFFFKPSFVANKSIMRVCIFWMLVTPVLFLMPQVLAALVICGFILTFLTPRDLEERAAFYIMTLLAVPSAIQQNVPFPGINYLIELDFAKVAAFVLLIPAILLARKPHAARYAPLAGILVGLMTLLFCAHVFRTENITNGLRGSLNLILLYAAPYWALVRLMSSTDRYDKIFSSFIMISVIFFFAAFISQLTNWNYYSYLQERFGVPVMADFRNGILRVSVTTIPILVGYIAAVGLLATEYFRAERRCGFAMAWIYRGMFLATALFTFSRGAWLALIVALGVFFLFTKFPRGVRPAIVGGSVFIGAPLFIAYLMRVDLSQYDEYGTFEYRRELLNSAMVQISQHPLFGDPYYLLSGNFDENVQGEGIVDVVNYYLQIALEHGLIGLALFVAPFAAVALGLLGLGKSVKARNDKTFERRRAVMLALIASYLAMVATVSAVSLVPHLGVIVLGLSAAFLAAARQEIRDGVTAGDANAQPSFSDDAPEPARPRDDAGAAMGDLYG